MVRWQSVSSDHQHNLDKTRIDTTHFNQQTLKTSKKPHLTLPVTTKLKDIYRKQNLNNLPHLRYQSNNQKKKEKVLSRSNSSTKLDEKNSDSTLQFTEPFFSSVDNNSSITYLQFKYIIENFGNKQMYTNNIHTLFEDIGLNIP